MHLTRSEYLHQFSKFFFAILINSDESVRHPNIISYKESFFEDMTSSLCIVMELADGGDLLNKI
jgi:serine/threonine protein kinase